MGLGKLHAQIVRRHQVQIEERRPARRGSRHAVQPFEHQTVVVHRESARLRSVEEPVVAHVVEGRQAVPRTVVARQHEPGLIALIVQHVLQLKRACADVEEVAAGQRAGDAAEGFRAGREGRSTRFIASVVPPSATGMVWSGAVTVDVHAIGPQGIHDDKDDMLGARSRHDVRVRRPEATASRAGHCMPPVRRLERESLGTEEAGHEFVLPEQAVAAPDSPPHGPASGNRQADGGPDRQAESAPRAGDGPSWSNAGARSAAA
jgi:hypothetical protein